MIHDESKNEIKNNQIHKKVKKLVNKIEQNDKIMEKMMGNEIVIEGLADPFAKIKRFFDDIGKFFVNIGRFVNDMIEDIKAVKYRFEMIGYGMRDILQGIFVESPKAVAEGIARGFLDIVTLFRYFGEFLRTYVMCGVKYMQNFHKCVLYYTLDSLGQILYVPVRLILWFLLVFLKRDLYGTADKVWGYLESLDSYIYRYLGFHISHYPKNVRDMCYNCKRLKVAAMSQKASDIKYDFENRIPAIMRKGVDLMYQGKIELDVAGRPSRSQFNNEYNAIKADDWSRWGG